MKKSNEKKKRKVGKIILRILCVFACVLVLFIASTSVVSFMGNRANTKKIDMFKPVEYENQLIPEKDENGNWFFTTDRDFKVVQLTDVHIGAGWMSLKKDANALNAVASMLSVEKPDLVVVTGDISYPMPFQSGTINNKSSARIFAELMEQLGIYWTLGFGNHDTEAYSFYNRDEIADFYVENYEHCLLQKGPEEVDGSSNHFINVKNTKGIITQTIFILDSHSYTDNDWFGIMWKYDNIHDNQIEWYKKTVQELNEENNETYRKLGKDKKSDIKSIMFLHIPLIEEKQAWDEYVENGYKDTEDVKMVYGFAGGSGKMVFCGLHEDQLFETVQEVGSTQGIFFGHDHRNNMSIDYKGTRLTYGMSIDYLAIPGISKIGRQRGCTVISISPEGNFESHNENYYQEKYASVFEKEVVEMQDITYPCELV